jgi:hypothetical protein
MRSRALRRIIIAAMGLGLAASATVAVTPAGADSNAVGPVATEKQFVTQQYQDFLGRQPDRAGLDYWVTRMKQGAGGSALVNAFATSPEFEGRIAPVVRLYYAYFLRAPDYEGLRFWAGRLEAGASVRAVSEEFAKSAEFVNTYGALDNRQFVELVYRNVLEREADGPGLDYWLAQMAAGVGRGRVMLGFSDSVENRAEMDPLVKATMLYVGLLGRAPDALGLDYWSGRLRDGGSYKGAIGGFLTSAEYRARMDGIYREVQPLTGERVRAANTGPALAVKVDNHNSSRPQSMLHRADIVIEEEVEYTVTRFVALYHSDIPATVGPIRSARTTDFSVLAAYNDPLLVSSGANPIVLALLDNAPVINRNQKTLPTAYFRSSSRSAPHNLYARTATVLASAPDEAAAPQPIFRYRPSGVSSRVGAPTGGVRIDFGHSDVTYTWNPAAKGWRRTQNGTAHKMDDGTIIAPDNVVVQETSYGVSVADSNTPEAETTGTGRVHVFTDGKYISGQWSRANKQAPTTLTDDEGQPILLTPGETWVALARPQFITLR